ncbi:hypothetical protein PHAVU_003G108000 [Phaseolus vulgaris]|uniref:Uncharacterized protein n=1 Tax=Phaseolus vulgaris TaxID=3885 RepID=V7CAK7_PHAVU|nr:hypothetical protein PHAVU_003G108000g [Phaseolus vulgaris]ESW26305.1 hypothetical protein PHAVU_003G108000g [Phaseolus vulgaris]
MINIMMVADTVAVTAAKGLGVLRACQSTCNLSLTDSAADQISSMIQPYDAVAPPPVKPVTYRQRRRTLLRRKQRTKRILSGDHTGDAVNDGFLFGDGGDGSFGGGSGFGGGGGSGWNFNRFGGGHNWDEPSSSVPDPAFDFVYQVLSWIMLSNCLHFSIKKIVRIVAAGSIVDSGREKVPSRLVPIC